MCNLPAAALSAEEQEMIQRAEDEFLAAVKNEIEENKKVQAAFNEGDEVEKVRETKQRRQQRRWSCVLA